MTTKTTPRSGGRNFSTARSTQTRPRSFVGGFRAGEVKSSSFGSKRGNFRPTGRPIFSGSRAGGTRFGGSRPSFGGRRSAGRGRFKSDRIDERLFINRATPETKEPEYVPKNTFTDFNVHPTLTKNIVAKGFQKPSPIQDQSIPVIMEGKDVIGIANTGTGKTAAFLVPIINNLAADRKSKAMILTPTRELAQQIEAEFRALSYGMRLWSTVAVGGAPILRQIRFLERGVNIVIGTPGRVKDLIERKKIDMSEYKTIVLDEADRMLDMGFIDDMRLILGQMPKDKQGLFFSATFSTEIKALCSDFLNDPVTVSIKTRDTAASIDQNIVRVMKGQDKLDVLHDILIKDDVKKVIIFRETKKNTDELARELKSRGFAVSALHGDMRLRERTRAVSMLDKGEIQAVIATDVAARGIDIKDVTHVINFDIPSTYDTYVHRIGRTGRGDKKGVALTFVN